MLFVTEAVLLTRNLTASSHKGVIAMFGEHFEKVAYLGETWAKL